MNYVYSTLSCSNVYPIYDKQVGGNTTVVHNIKINGGANVMQHKRVDVSMGGGVIPLETPRGVVTVVDDSDMEFLLKDATFQQHMKNGFITFDKKEKPVEKVVESMTPADDSAQLTKKTFLKGKKEGLSISTDKV
jgi:hypothetical protein